MPIILEKKGGSGPPGPPPWIRLCIYLQKIRVATKIIIVFCNWNF